MNTGGTPANGSGTFDAPLIDPNLWSGTPVGTGSFSVALSPTATGGPSSIAATETQPSGPTWRYLVIGDLSSSSATGLSLAVVSDQAFALGATTVDGVHLHALVFSNASGTVTAQASAGTLTLTAAGSALGQRVTGSLSATFFAVSSTCTIDADCLPGEVCRAGTCTQPAPTCRTNADCASGEVCQSGACVAAPTCTSSAQCAAGQVCQRGACVSCASGQVVCGASCVSIQNDPANCGACGAVCSSGLCRSGLCVAPPACRVDTDCASGQVCRSGTCVAGPQCTSSAQCAAGQICQGGACVSCGSGQLACGASCVSTQTDPSNCGACGVVCSSGQCQSSVCVSVPACRVDTDCSSGQVCRSGTCVVPLCTTSAQCPSGQQCQSGVCVGTGSGCSRQSGTGSYSGTFGAVSVCTAAGAGVSVTNAVASLDQGMGGSPELSIMSPSAAQIEGLMIDFAVCPGTTGTLSLAGGAATLYSTAATGASGVDIIVRRTNSGGTITFTQVGSVVAGSFSVTFPGGTVTGTFTVR